MTRHQGLYDGIADVLQAHLQPFNTRAISPKKDAKGQYKGTYTHVLIATLIDDLCTVLRLDNAAFNEERFRARVVARRNATPCECE